MLYELSLGDVIQGGMLGRLPSAWNTTTTLHQSFGINWEMSCHFYIPIASGENYVNIFCPMVRGTIGGALRGA